MDTTGATTVYSTSTEGKPQFEALALELREELGLPLEDQDYSWLNYDESDYYQEWCFVCSRPTDHRGEHDDLVAEGLARYDATEPMVYSR